MSTPTQPKEQKFTYNTPYGFFTVLTKLEKQEGKDEYWIRAAVFDEVGSRRQNYQYTGCKHDDSQRIANKVILDKLNFLLNRDKKKLREVSKAVKEFTEKYNSI